MISARLAYNAVVGAIRLGWAVKLDHMDVLSADSYEIVAGDSGTSRVFMRLRRSEQGTHGNHPQVRDFERRIFTDKGMEIVGKKSLCEQPGHPKEHPND
jgi:hypothetical protein